MSASINLRPFWMRLVKLGFSRIYPHNKEAMVYTRVDRDVDRKLEVQLWRDGLLRVTFWQPTKYAPDGFGRMSTEPTEFTSLEEMYKAIEYERTRDYERISINK